MEGGGLKENLAPLGNDTTRSCGLVGGSVTMEAGFEVSSHSLGQAFESIRKNSKCCLWHDVSRHTAIFPAPCHDNGLKF